MKIVIATMWLTAATGCQGGVVQVPGGGAVGSALGGSEPGAIVGLAGKCLDDSGDGTADGNKIQLWDCSGTDAQSWTYRNGQIVGPGGKCLDVQSNNQTNGTIVQLYTCNGTAAQQWTTTNNTIVSSGGYCLDVTGWGTSNGTPIEIWGCTGGGNQQWTSSGGSGPGPGPGPGNFRVLGGNIYDPNGRVYVAHGINIGPQDMSAPITSLFPGLNFIRLATWYTAPYSMADYQAFVSKMTALGIVVEIEDHAYPSPLPYSGQQLADESSWFASLASAFKGNPFVWFGSMNEPHTDTYGPAEAAITTQEVATYNAIRGTGSNAMIMMELFGGGNPGTIGAGFGFDVSAYASMTNIVWDYHFYGWTVINGGTNNTNVADIQASLAGSVSGGYGVAAAQTIQSADGMVPVILGEFGNSTIGASIDPNGQACVDVALAGGYGFAAWTFGGSGGADQLTDNGSLTQPYGTSVAAAIAALSN